MAKRSKTEAVNSEAAVSADGERIVAQGTKPLVFISHDSRDAALAEAFSNMLMDASAGVLKSFRSSDKKGSSGIDYGSEWYTRVMGALAECTDVVALLTQNSIGRPWLLYEAGVAKGRTQTSVVFGVTLGVPLEKAISGPFSQFQNCGDAEDDLTKLVMQLLRRVPDSAPREEAVLLQVKAFREKVSALLKHPAKSAADGAVDETAVVKLFEEVKVLFRDLPQQVEGKLRDMRPDDFRWRRRRIRPHMVAELLHSGEFFSGREEAASMGWLLFISMFRDEAPWFYEAGMEVYRALQHGHPRVIQKRVHALQQLVRFTYSHPMFRDLVDRGDKESYMLMHDLPMMADELLHRFMTVRRLSPSGATDSDEAVRKKVRSKKVDKPATASKK